MVVRLEDLRVQIYADGADFDDMCQLRDYELIKGYTTNPSLLKKSGVKDYEMALREMAELVSPLPISCEVFSNDLEGMLNQARKIAKWGSNVIVKIPVTNTFGESMHPVMAELASEGIALNITAVFTVSQVEKVLKAIDGAPVIISVFAGRIADTGRSALTTMVAIRDCIGTAPAKLLWASTREMYNIVEAEKARCDIITVPYDLITKFKLWGKSLDAYSHETVHGFYNDAQAAGYAL